MPRLKGFGQGPKVALISVRALATAEKDGTLTASRQQSAERGTGYLERESGLTFFL